MGIARVGTKWVYDFAEGSKEMRNLLGGKGANVAEMTRILGADRVPAGFTITTEACVSYMEEGQSVPAGMDGEVDEALARLEASAGKTLGDPDDPLLVSVRSGARESMPGMLDTVLNLGLNDRSVAGLAERTGNERFAWDSYRRFVQMFGNVVRSIPGERFEHAIQASKQEHGVTLDTELDVAALQALTATFREIFKEETGEEFPQEPRDQLDAGDPRRVRLLDRRPRRRLPAHQPHPRRLGHRGQRAADGLRQQGRHVGLRRRLQPRRGRRRARAVGRLPRQRAGRGRRLGRAQHAGHRRPARRHARGARDADGDPAHARGALQGHAGHGVHDRGRASVHAADAQREAARAGRGALRLRRRRRGPADEVRGDRDDRLREARRAAAPDVRSERRLRGARQGRRRVAGRGEGRDRLQRAGRRRRGSRGSRRHPRAPVHRGRGRRRLPRRARDPDRRGRQGEPRGARRARHGPARGHRRQRARYRPRDEAAARRRHRPRRGRPESRSTARPGRSRSTTSRSSSRR